MEEKGTLNISEAQSLALDLKEKSILNDLAKAEKLISKHRKNLVLAKKKVDVVESDLIQAKIERDRIQETLRVFKNTTPKQIPTLRELEIERFRKNNPEVVALAKQRDRDRP